MKIFGLILPAFLSLLAGCDDNDRPRELQLMGQLAIPGTNNYDVWGWVEPASGKEYALAGTRQDGLYIADASDPANPVVTSTVPGIPGFDVKTWLHYVYTVDGTGSGQGAIVDLSDTQNPVVVGGFPNSHNIFVDDRGYLYCEFPGLRIYDLNPDPTAPILVWSGGKEGHDATVIGTTLYDFHGTVGTNIYDVVDPANPVLTVSIVDPSIRYHHSGWPSKDGTFLFVCDELAIDPTADVTVWDIRTPDNPVRVGSISDSAATVHNLYVVGDYAYVAYYAAGFRIFDVSKPASPELVAEFDTHEFDQEGFDGAFGVYPFTPSGNIYVFDRDNGLFIFRFD